MSKGKKSSSSGTRNNDRKCGKAWKKRKRTGQEGANGKTVGGYSPAALLNRAAKRGQL